MNDMSYESPADLLLALPEDLPAGDGSCWSEAELVVVNRWMAGGTVGRPITATLVVFQCLEPALGNVVVLFEATSVEHAGRTFSIGWIGEFPESTAAEVAALSPGQAVKVSGVITEVEVEPGIRIVGLTSVLVRLGACAVAGGAALAG